MSCDVITPRLLNELAGASSNKSCQTCINGPLNSAYVNYGVASESCPWRCEVGYNTSLDGESCNPCPKLPANAKWIFSLACDAACTWTCKNGYQRGSSGDCRPCPQQIVPNATWAEVDIVLGLFTILELTLLTLAIAFYLVHSMLTGNGWL